MIAASTTLLTYVHAQFQPLNGLRLAISPEIEVWAIPVESSIIILVLMAGEQTQRPADVGLEGGRPTISRLLRDQFACFLNEADTLGPFQGIQWYILQHRFADVTIRSRDEWGARWRGMQASVTIPARNLEVHYIGVPLLLVTGLLLLYPSIHITLMFARWRIRMRSGACLACGYDLRGNVSGICPECGTAIDKSRRPKS